MRLNNFQHQVGGLVEGLIGIKHIQQFPKAVFHLQNGLTIFKHALRPAGDRSRVYCLGGSLPALQHFHRQAGSEANNILYSSIGDRDLCGELLFEGGSQHNDMMGLPPLLSDEKWREELSEGPSRAMQKELVTDALLVGSKNVTQLDFCVRASNKQTP
jgi:hypothetical protein